jgi:hypothetical protein
MFRVRWAKKVEKEGRYFTTMVIPERRCQCSGESFDCINRLYLNRVTEKVLLGFPMEYVEAYASRAGFFLLCEGKILWAHSVRFHPMFQHVTRSRGWNITEQVNKNAGNEIELGMVIPTIKS